MRDRIGTLSYNTDTAKKIADYRNDYPVNDFHFYREALYKKRTGEYFLAGEGGPSSKYAEETEGGNMMQGGSKIIPLSFDAAKEWYKNYILDSDYEDKKETEQIYHHEFEPDINDDETMQTSITLTIGAKRKLEKIAAKQHISQSQVIENLIKAE